MKNTMKNAMKKMFSVLMAVAILCSFSVPSAFAVSGNTKCYTIPNYNITAYSNTGLSKKVGTIFPSDELQVLQVTSRYCQVSYPLSKGGRRTAYIPTSSILWGTGGSTVTASGKLTTYRRSGGSSYGYVSKGDRVTILGKSGSWWQVKYPVSGGFKYAMVRSSEASRVLGGQSSGSTNAGTSLTNALYGINVSGSYISCGFDGYRNTKGRHEGIDFSKSYGSNVYSLTDGVVTRVANGYNGSNGLSTIAIYYAPSNKTVIYLHSAPVSGLKAGSQVKRGQKIATEAYRGISSKSGSHTHVEVRNGKQTYACKSVNDYKLDNSNPSSFWSSLGYTVR